MDAAIRFSLDARLIAISPTVAVRHDDSNAIPTALDRGTTAVAGAARAVRLIHGTWSRGGGAEGLAYGPTAVSAHMSRPMECRQWMTTFFVS